MTPLFNTFCPCLGFFSNKFICLNYLVISTRFVRTKLQQQMQNPDKSMSYAYDTCEEEPHSDSQDDMAPYIQQKIVNNAPFVCIQGNAIKDLLHRSIVAIHYENPNLLAKKRYMYGSGVLLSNDLVLTAAHNLYEKEQNYWQGMQYQKDCFKIFEGTEDGIVSDYHRIKDWRYLEEFKTCKPRDKLQYDYALIKLEPNPQRPINYDKFLELRPPCKCVLERSPKLKLEIYGFPEEYQNYTPLDKEFRRLKIFQYGHTESGAILEAQPKDFKITYAINTMGGHSGSPVAVGYQICAIHTGGARKEQDNWNFGRLITPDLVHNIKTWARELESIPNFIEDKAFCPHQQEKINLNQEIQQKKQQLLQITTKLQSLFTPTITQVQQLKASEDKLMDQYKYELALEQYKKSIFIYEQLKGKDSIEVARILIYCIGDIYKYQGKYQLALEAYERGKAICLEKAGAESYNSAASLMRIANVYHLRAEYDAALENYNNALIIWQKVNGNDNLEAGIIISKIGLVYIYKGDYPQAFQYLKRSLQVFERAGEDNSIEAAQTHNNIGTVYWRLKEYSLALHHYEKALSIYQRIKGKDSVEAAVPMMNIGIVYYDQGDFPHAVEMYKRAIAIYEKHQLRHRWYAAVHLNLGNTYFEMKKYGLAAAAYRVALPIYEQMGLAAEMKMSSLGLARCLSILGEVDQLERIIKEYEVDRSEI